MKKLSLRGRLIIYFTLISLLMGLIAGFFSWQETREKTDEFFDTYQMALARQLAAADWSNVTPQTQKITNKLIKKVRNAEDEDEAIGFAVFDHSGKLIFHDGENGRNFIYTPETGNYLHQKIVGDDDDWRIIWINSANGRYVIGVGQELEYRREVAWDMAEEFLMPWLTGLLLLLLTIIGLITWELRPLNRLALKLSRRREDDLSPLNGRNIPQEVQPLIKALNLMLEKLSQTLQRERRFVADAAHELRSPLTALKVQLEVAELAQDDENTQKKALQKLGEGIERSSRLVEQLLALSKLENAPAPGEEDEIDWPAVTNQLCEDFKEALGRKSMTINTKISPNTVISRGNPLWCSLLLRNLLDNAVKYSPQGAKIAVEITDSRISVTNSGCKLKKADLAKLGQRFFRPAGQKIPGSGLGLSIVNRIAGLYGCVLEIKNSPHGVCAAIKKYK